MTARDIIAGALIDSGSHVAARYEHESADEWRARAVEHALSAAGYRILGPGELAVTDEMVDAAIEAENAAFENVRMVECKRCDGRGYHHGFGEDGADPDWCSHCGGGGYEAADGEDTRPMREAIQAALRALRESGG